MLEWKAGVNLLPRIEIKCWARTDFKNWKGITMIHFMFPTPSPLPPTKNSWYINCFLLVIFIYQSRAEYTHFSFSLFSLRPIFIKQNLPPPAFLWNINPSTLLSQIRSQFDSIPILISILVQSINPNPTWSSSITYTGGARARSGQHACPAWGGLDLKVEWRWWGAKVIERK